MNTAECHQEGFGPGLRGSLQWSRRVNTAECHSADPGWPSLRCTSMEPPCEHGGVPFGRSRALSRGWRKNREGRCFVGPRRAMRAAGRRLIVMKYVAFSEIWRLASGARGMRTTEALARPLSLLLSVGGWKGGSSAGALGWWHALGATRRPQRGLARCRVCRSRRSTSSRVLRRGRCRRRAPGLQGGG